MSDTHAHPDHAESGHGHGEPVRQADDKANLPLLFTVGLAGVIVTIVGIFVSYGYQRAMENDLGPVAADPKTLPGHYKALGEAGIIERDMLSERPGAPFVDGEAQQLRASKEALLSTYGWIDRPHNLIHVPIGQAMDQVVNAYGQKK